MPENIVPEPVVPILADTAASDRNFATQPVIPTVVEGSPHKKFPLLISILLILFSLAAVLAIYLFLQVRTLTLEKTTSSSPTPTPIASADPMADWKTYSNEEYHFSFSYPPELSNSDSQAGLKKSTDKVKEDAGLEYPYSSYIKIFSLSAQKTAFDTTGQPIKVKLWELSGTVSQTKIAQSLSDISTQLNQELDMNSNIHMVQISDYQALRYQHCEMACEEIMVMPYKDKYLQMSLYENMNIGIGDIGPIFDQILSTFKFIESDISKLPGSCIPTYKIETNTEELTAKQNYSMYCSEKHSETDCLEVDLYNKKDDNFNTPDKISDCEWKKIIINQ